MRHGRVKANRAGQSSKSRVTAGTDRADQLEAPEEVAPQTRSLGSSDLQTFMNDEDFFMGNDFSNVLSTSSASKDFAFDYPTSDLTSFPVRIKSLQYTTNILVTFAYLAWFNLDRNRTSS